MSWQKIIYCTYINHESYKLCDHDWLCACVLQLCSPAIVQDSLQLRLRRFVLRPVSDIGVFLWVELVVVELNGRVPVDVFPQGRPVRETTELYPLRVAVPDKLMKVTHTSALWNLNE